MDRLELIRTLVDKEIEKIQQPQLRRIAYVHTYGVSQLAVLLATVRNADPELAAIAAMLHDISQYTLNAPLMEHAKKSAEYAKKLLKETGLFQEEEQQIICNVIAAHSDKASTNDGTISEILKDADVFQHYLYNPKIPLAEKDQFRLFYLLEDLKEVKKRKAVSK